MKFSIITVSLNAETLIRDTIESVLRQDFEDYEIIVKDGLSKDKTLEMIPQSDKIRIVQKADTGIYQAMNQGIAEARGDYLLFLNCGDKFYHESVLSQAAKALDNHGPCILYGNQYFGDLLVCYPHNIAKRHFYSATICHQASFIAKELFETVGLYDEKLTIASDWKFFLDAKIQKVPFVYFECIVCLSLPGGVSDTAKGHELTDKERQQVISSRFNVFEVLWSKLINSKMLAAFVRLKHKMIK